MACLSRCSISLFRETKFKDWDSLNNRHVSLPILEAAVRDPGVPRLVPLEASLGRVDSRLLPVSSCGHPSLCVFVLISSPYKDPRLPG